MADFIMVNSKFTAETFKNTFTSLAKVPITVMYPSINMRGFDVSVDKGLLKDMLPPKATTIFLSINRYERKKNLALALEALREFKKKVDSEIWKKTHLIMAGLLISFIFILLFLDLMVSLIFSAG